MDVSYSEGLLPLRQSLSEPIARLMDAVRYLDAAVSAHLERKFALAEDLLRLADIAEIRVWGKSIWANSDVHVRSRSTEPTLPKELRSRSRLPTSAQKERVHARDGYHCRFCGMPVVKSSTRKLLHLAYPLAVPWGAKKSDQHAALLAMWAQYDHVIPHSRGGLTDHDNLVLTCAPCNFGRAGFMLEEVGVAEPWLRPPVKSAWDGLERFRPLSAS